MRPLRSLICYVAIIFLGAALLSPWLYWLVHWVAARSPAFAGLAKHPFHRYVNRSLLVIAVVGLLPFLRSIGADSWSAVGLVRPAGQWRRLAAGFALGFVSLICVVLLDLGCGARALRSDISAAHLLKEFGSAALAAVLVGLLEELLFRGALVGALRKAHGWTTALVVSSAFYALVHFFQKPAPPLEITWTSGFEVLPQMLSGFANLETLVPGFFTLLLAGMILGLAYQRTGNLYLSIGLHGGWIFWLKFYGAMTVPTPGASPWFRGSGNLIDGWLGLVILLAILLAVWRFPVEKEATAGAV